jgi:hypothetical protein
LKIAVVNPEYANALSLIALMEGGVAMCTREVHPLNALAPISSSPLLRLAVVNPEQPLNAEYLIALTEGGVVICTRNVHA